MGQGSRTDAVKAALLAEVERRRPELDSDRSIERVDFVVLVTRRGPVSYRVQFRKACSPLDGE